MGNYQQRSANWVIQKAFAEAKAKAVLPTGSKYALLLTLLDNEHKNWQDEEGVQWDSLYITTVLDETVSATDTVALSKQIRELSERQGDYVLVGDRPYKVVAPSQLYTHRKENVVSQVGRNLKFPQAFAANSSAIGASITVPGYTYVNDIIDGSTLVQCDNPMYLVYTLAASYARNDIVKTGQYNNILDKATVLMNKMKEANGGQMDELQMEWSANGEMFV